MAIIRYECSLNNYQYHNEALDEGVWWYEWTSKLHTHMSKSSTVPLSIEKYENTNKQTKKLPTNGITIA